MMSNDQNDKDLEFLEKYYEQHSDSIVFARLADAYLKMDKISAATELCEEGIKKHPYYATGHFVLGKCYLAKKQYELAEKEFKRVLLFDPKFLAAHKYYGDLMKEIGWENTCEASYKKILQIDPLDEVARSMAGEYIIEGKQENVTETFELPPEDDAEKDIDQSVEKMEIEPMPITPEEEDMLFTSEEAEDETEQKIDEIEDQVTQIDDEQAEEFSYILDDIFKDEVVEDENDSSSVSIDDEASEESSMDFPDQPENYLAQLRIDEEETEESGENKTVDHGFESTDFEAELRSNVDPEMPETFREFDSAGFEEKAFQAEPQKPEPSSTQSVNRKKRSDKIVTPTLGEIYAAQGQYAKAIDVFETLIKKHPDNDFYLKKIDHLKQKLAEAKDA